MLMACWGAGSGGLLWEGALKGSVTVSVCRQVFAAAALFPFKRAVGVEVSTSPNALSMPFVSVTV